MDKGRNAERARRAPDQEGMAQPCDTEFKAKGEGPGGTRDLALMAANTAAMATAIIVCKANPDCKRAVFQRYEEVEIIPEGDAFRCKVTAWFKCEEEE